MKEIGLNGIVSKLIKWVKICFQNRNTRVSNICLILQNFLYIRDLLPTLAAVANDFFFFNDAM